MRQVVDIDYEKEWRYNGALGNTANNLSGRTAATMDSNLHFSTSEERLDPPEELVSESNRLKLGQKKIVVDYVKSLKEVE